MYFYLLLRNNIFIKQRRTIKNRNFFFSAKTSRKGTDSKKGLVFLERDKQTYQYMVKQASQLEGDC
jgi:hypothetical protein